MILISDDSPFKDNEITVDDFVIRGNPTGKIVITNIYNKIEYYDEIYDDYVVSYNFSYKGTVVGNAYVYLDAYSVTDEAGNCNWPTQSKTIYISMLPPDQIYFDEIGEYFFSLVSQVVLVPFNFFAELLRVLI